MSWLIRALMSMLRLLNATHETRLPLETLHLWTLVAYQDSQYPHCEYSDDVAFTFLFHAKALTIGIKCQN
jgi:hypothetical protein